MVIDYFNLTIFQFFFAIFRATKEINKNIQYVTYKTYKQISIGYKSYAISFTTYIYIYIYRERERESTIKKYIQGVSKRALQL